MYKIKFTTSFKRIYKLMKKRGLDLTLLDNIIIRLANGEILELKYHNHELTGKFKGFRECHIKPIDY